MMLKSPKGTYDLLPLSEERWKESACWNHVETLCATLAERFGFKEIRTPLFESTELFTRGVGDESDIVSKELYTFLDKKGRSMSLRPEMTASVMRAFIEHQMQQQGSFHKLYYLGPMFRYDRPQKGRYRQFTQFGIEIIGSKSPLAEGEMFDLFYTFLSALGLKNVLFHINTIGTKEERARYQEALQAFLMPQKERLSPDSQRRLMTNPLRILDSKEKEDHEALLSAPTLDTFLGEESKSNFNEVLSLLEALGIPYKIDPKLVRGLDYYHKTVFEVYSGELGSQSALGGGGRYDGLLKKLGGSDLPSLGFGIGLERIIQMMLVQNAPFPQAKRPLLYLIGVGKSAEKEGLHLVQQARKAGLYVEMELQGRPLKKALAFAESKGAYYSAVLGDNELRDQKIKLKQMQDRTEKEIPLSLLLKEIEDVRL